MASEQSTVPGPFVVLVRAVVGTQGEASQLARALGVPLHGLDDYSVLTVSVADECKRSVYGLHHWQHHWDAQVVGPFDQCEYCGRMRAVKA